MFRFGFLWSPAQVTVEVDDQESNGDDGDQKRRESQPEITAGPEKNSLIGTEHNRQLILEQAQGQQMGLQSVLCPANCFLVGSVTKNHDH